MTAIALFGGSYFSDRRLAFAVPMLALLLSDIALGLWFSWSFMAVQPHMWVQYATFALIVGMGLLLRERRGIVRVGLVALSASCVFFVITNLFAWAFQPVSKTAPDFGQLRGCDPFFRTARAIWSSRRCCSVDSIFRRRYRPAAPGSVA